MAELTSTTDAPPPPPPPPPPADSKQSPDVSPELASALARDRQASGTPDVQAGAGAAAGDAVTSDQLQQAGKGVGSSAELSVQPDVQQAGQDQGGSPPDAIPSNQPQPDASTELRSALASTSPVVDAVPVNAVSVDPASTSELAKNGEAGSAGSSGNSADTADLALSRKKWESSPEGSDLPQSMKEDLQKLGGDLKEIVDPVKWGEANDDGRKEMLNTANDRIREEYGLPKQDVSYRSVAEDPELKSKDPEYVIHGYHDQRTGEIVINSDELKSDSDPQEAVGTLAHENFHSYQLQALKGSPGDPYAQSRLNDWHEGFANNVASDANFKVYANQAHEKDTFAVEDEVCKGYEERVKR